MEELIKGFLVFGLCVDVSDDINTGVVVYITEVTMPVR